MRGEIGGIQIPSLRTTHLAPADFPCTADPKNEGGKKEGKVQNPRPRGKCRDRGKKGSENLYWSGVASPELW